MGELLSNGPFFGTVFYPAQAYIWLLVGLATLILSEGGLLLSAYAAYMLLLFRSA